eukprot:g1160.t1
MQSRGLGPAEAAILAEFLMENKECKLEKLDISRNSLGAEGARHIAKALEVNTSLTSLSLRYNDIGPEGAKQIAKALQDHASVTSVDLRDNNLSVESGSALAAVAKKNPRIKEMCGIPLDSLREKEHSTLRKRWRLNTCNAPLT